MSQKSIELLEKKVSLPFRFTTELPFIPEDLTEMTWLSKSTRFYGVENEVGKFSDTPNSLFRSFV